MFSNSLETPDEPLKSTNDFNEPSGVREYPITPPVKSKRPDARFEEMFTSRRVAESVNGSRGAVRRSVDIQHPPTQRDPQVRRITYASTSKSATHFVDPVCDNRDLNIPNGPHSRFNSSSRHPIYTWDCFSRPGTYVPLSNETFCDYSSPVNGSRTKFPEPPRPHLSTIDRRSAGPPNIDSLKVVDSRTPQPAISPNIPKQPRGSISTTEVARQNGVAVKPDFVTLVPQTSAEPFVGLFNRGNTCYMSAILQCLRFTPLLYKVFVAHPDAPTVPPKLVTCLGALFRGMTERVGHHVLGRQVEDIKTVLSTIAPHYKSHDQQDALEFLVYLLDNLHSELKCPKVAPPVKNSTSSSSNLKSHGNDTAVYNDDSTQSSKSSFKRTGGFRSLLLRSRRKGVPSSFPLDSLVDCAIDSSVSLPDSCLNSVQYNTSDYKHPAVRAWETESATEASVIRDTFMGQLQNYRKCMKCGLERVSYDVSWSLSVPIPNLGCTPSVPRSTEGSHHRSGGPCTSDQAEFQLTAPLRKNSVLYDGLSALAGGMLPTKTGFQLFDDSNVNAVDCRLPNATPQPSNSCLSASSDAAQPVAQINLSDCLKAFVATEILDGTERPWCDRCNAKSHFLVQQTISRLPDVLVIHFLRYNCGVKQQKNCAHVGFDMKVDMGDYMISEFEKTHNFPPIVSSESDTTYWLYAVVYHVGQLNYGHYTTCCRVANPDDTAEDQWYHFDDDVVSEIGSKEVNHPAAYLLFYEKDSLYRQRKLEAKLYFPKDSVIAERSHQTSADASPTL